MNPIQATDEIRSAYLRYLGTTFALDDPSLRAQFRLQLAAPGRLVKGPLLEATPPFVDGRTVRDLVKDGILHRDFLKLDPAVLPPDRPLRQDQESAIRKVASGRNILVSTGTGSGKTECFLLPIIDSLMREHEAGTLGPGVRALLLYPMNALANDQLARLRALLARYAPITFGRYIGDTRHTQKEALEKFQDDFPGEPELPNELLSREKMRQSPPHIILTNYAMLEYLLIRPADSELFGTESGERTWRFIVVDEAHVYGGATGIEVGMLMRRLKNRVENPAHPLQCIGTSATVGGGPHHFPGAARFMETLLDAPFEHVPGDPNRQDVITGTRLSLEIEDGAEETRPAELYPLLHALTSAPDAETVSRDALRSAWINCSLSPESFDALAPPDAATHDLLYALLSPESRVRALRTRLMVGPVDMETAARDIFGDVEDTTRQLECLVALVGLAASARLQAHNAPLLPARYHLFARALEGVFVCLRAHASQGGAPKLFLERRTTCDECGPESRVVELASCRRCGQDFVMGVLREEEDAAGVTRVVLRPAPVGYLDDSTGAERAWFIRTCEESSTHDEDEDVAEGREVGCGRRSAAAPARAASSSSSPTAGRMRPSSRLISSARTTALSIGS